MNGDHVRNMTSALMGPLLQESGITNQSFCNENLLVTVMNLFTAGLETTSGTLRWGLVFMAKYPKIQGKELKISTRLEKKK